MKARKSKIQDPTRQATGCGITLEHIDKGQKAAVSFTAEVRHEMTNPYGNIHGGMMSLVIDEAIGWAVISMDTEQHYTSLTLNLDFLYAIKEGNRLRAVTRRCCAWAKRSSMWNAMYMIWMGKYWQGPIATSSLPTWSLFE